MPTTLQAGCWGPGAGRPRAMRQAGCGGPGAAAPGHTQWVHWPHRACHGHHRPHVDPPRSRKNDIACQLSRVLPSPWLRKKVNGTQNNYALNRFYTTRTHHSRSRSSPSRARSTHRELPVVRRKPPRAAPQRSKQREAKQAFTCGSLTPRRFSSHKEEPPRRRRRTRARPLMWPVALPATAQHVVHANPCEWLQLPTGECGARAGAAPSAEPMATTSRNRRPRRAAASWLPAASARCGCVAVWRVAPHPQF